MKRFAISLVLFLLVLSGGCLADPVFQAYDAIAHQGQSSVNDLCARACENHVGRQYMPLDCPPCPTPAPGR